MTATTETPGPDRGPADGRRRPRPARPSPPSSRSSTAASRSELLVPLWTEIGDLMPLHPQSAGRRRTCGAGTDLLRARRAAPGDLVPVGRGGERRAIALANPSPGRQAVRHPDAVGGDPVPDAGRGRPRAPAHPERVPLRRRGRGRVDRRRAATRSRCAAATSCRRPAGTGTPTTTPPSSRWPGSTGSTSRSSTTPSRSSSSSAATRSATTERITPDRSRSERLWGHPGLRPSRSSAPTAGTPLLAYRWEHTDRALDRPARARGRGLRRHRRARPRRVRFTNPTTGGDVLPTIRTEMHRVAAARETAPRARGRLVGLPGLRRLRHRHRRRHELDGHPRRPVRRPVAGSRSRFAPRPAAPTPTPARSTSSGSATHPSSRRSTSTAPPAKDYPMKLATIRIARRHGTRAVRVDGRHARRPRRRRPRRAPRDRRTGGESAAAADRDDVRRRRAPTSRPLVPRPGKVVCVGLNYRNHILEMGRDLPEHPTLFSKFADTLIGAHDDIAPPGRDRRVRLGGRARRRHRRRRCAAPTTAQAAAAIAGFTVLNDITCRDWQFRTREWLQGKNWEATTPVGPWLSPPTSCPAASGPPSTITLRGRRRGRCRRTTPATCSSTRSRWSQYVSTIITPRARRPHRHRHPRRRRPRPQARASTSSAGETVVTEIEGIGRLENVVVEDPS